MNTKIIARIARNIGRLTGAIHSDKSTSMADARFIGDSCLEALALHRDVVIAEHLVEVAERRLDGARPQLPAGVIGWAEECIRDTREFFFKVETERRS